MKSQPGNKDWMSTLAVQLTKQTRNGWGMVSNPNEKGFQEVLKQYNIDLNFIVKRMDMYNTCRLKQNLQGGIQK